MVVGQPPFYSENRALVDKRIVSGDFEFPDMLGLTTDCKDLITKLLTKNPLQRLGKQNDAKDIIKHPWFKGFDFSSLIKLEVIYCV